MEKLNVVELLKDCPSGMELDCTIYEDVVFHDIADRHYPIRVRRKQGGLINLNAYGCMDDKIDSKCVIFPKGKTTWEGFQRPFKDGDILSYQCTGFRNRTIYIYRNHSTMNTSYYVALGGDLEFMVNHKEGHALSGYNTTARLATEEEKQKLFDAIKAKGYRWNAETKTLIRPVFPKFHEGDWVIDKQGLVHQIENVVENITNHTFGYDIVGGGYFNDNSDVRLWTIKDAKDGDVLAAHECLVLFKKLDGLNIKCYCTYHFMDNQSFYVDTLQNKDAFHPATEEEKKKLFDAIKDNGYKWDAETKTLERLNQPKFKDGDILYCNANDDGEDKDMFKYIFIFDKIVDGKFYYAHCHLFGNKFYDTKVNLVHGYSVRFATEEEKQKLFQAIKDNSYKWNSETKTLEKLIELNFKVGNKIRNIKTGQIHTVTHTYGSNKYISFQVDNCGYAISHEFQDDYELVPDKFDINTLVPFESRVLIRDTKLQKWSPAIWGFYDSDSPDYRYKLVGVIARYCIPYENNEHLLGKTDDCDEFYKTWEKTGD